MSKLIENHLSSRSPVRQISTEPIWGNPEGWSLLLAFACGQINLPSNSKSGTVPSAS